MPATFHIVATPIGNLGDITYRAVEVLGRVSLIACEDTRQTRKLLTRYGITTPTLSCHQHNEAARIPQFIERLHGGQDIALVCDAGTPLLSDPGARLLAAVLAEGFAIVPIPGPSAILATLAGSGLPADSFRFEGFLPSKPHSRRRTLESLRQETSTLVLFETPHRILAALTDIADVFGARPLVLGREITKLHEEFLRGTPLDVRQILASRPAIQGEITLAIAGAEQARGRPAEEEILRAVVADMAAGVSKLGAVKAAARRWKIPKREVYRLVERGKGQGSPPAAPEEPGGVRRQRRRVVRP